MHTTQWLTQPIRTATVLRPAGLRIFSSSERRISEPQLRDASRVGLRLSNDIRIEQLPSHALHGTAFSRIGESGSRLITDRKFRVYLFPACPCVLDAVFVSRVYFSHARTKYPM